MAHAPTTTAISANPVKNRGGTVAGTAHLGANSPMTKALSVADLNYKDTFGAFMSRVIPPLHQLAINRTGYAYSGQPFAQMRKNQYIIVKVTKLIANQAQTSLYMSPNSWWRRSIAFNEHQNTRITKGITYNYYTGFPSAGGDMNYGTPGMPIVFVNPPATKIDQFGTDNAARPSRAVPGSIVYDYGRYGAKGGPAPKQVNTSAKNT